jgi:Spy/CpxP family protein refolding chaperone
MAKKVLIVLLALLCLISTGAVAAMPWGGGRGPAEKMVERIAKELNLTQQQKDKFVTGAKQVEEEAGKVRIANKEIFTKIEKELAKDSPDSKQINSYLQEMNNNQTKIQFKRMEQLIQLRKELTPEQKIKLENLMKKKKGQFNKRHDIIRKSKGD